MEPTDISGIHDQLNLLESWNAQCPLNHRRVGASLLAIDTVLNLSVQQLSRLKVSQHFLTDFLKQAPFSQSAPVRVCASSV